MLNTLSYLNLILLEYFRLGIIKKKVCQSLLKNSKPFFLFGKSTLEEFFEI